jgi:hypothetical protein
METKHTKECFKCHQNQPLSNFYAHPTTNDGRLGKCKDCTKKDVQEHYQNNRVAIAEYDKQRNQRPERKRARVLSMRKRRLNSPLKHKAYYLVQRAIATGSLVPQPCIKCGAKAEAHHEDYSKPLDVMWLCFKHHREHHGQTVRDS